ncbi:MAG TPA: hypothetical protein PKL31_13260 [Fulvivirga sp.]|nr:hypothetical protein [Fulvivirga sp.]
MDSSRIDKLLEKYWEGETSLEEEKELKDYFASGEVEARFNSVAPLFNYYKEEANVGLDTFFDERMIAKLEKTETKRKVQKPGRMVELFSNIAKVAAVGLIVIVAGYFIRQEMKKDEIKPYLTDTFDDPQKAFEETKKALELISRNFNKGRKEAKKITTFNEAQEKVKSENQL